MKILKQTLLVLSITAAAAAMLALHAVLLLNTDFAQARARRVINGLIPGSITWERLSVSPLTGRIEITKAVLAGEDRRTIAGFDRLRARISLWSALRGKLDIAEARVEKPECFLELDENGRLNIVKALGIKPKKKRPQKKPGRLPGFLVVGKCELSDGRFGFARPSAGFDLGIRDIRGSAGLDFKLETGTITLTVGGGHLTVKGRRTDLKRLALESAVTRGIAERLRLKLLTTSSDLTIRGDIEELFRNPAFNVSAAYSISLPELRDILNVSRPLDGTARGAFTARGTVNNPSIALRADYSGGSILGNRVDGIRADIRMEDRLISIRSLKALAGSGYLELAGAIDLRDAYPAGFIRPAHDPDRISYTLAATCRNLGMGKIPGLRGNVRGLIDADISFSGRGVRAGSASAALTVKGAIRNFAIGQKAVPAMARLSSEAVINRGTIRVDAFEATLGGARLLAGGSIDTATKAIRGAFSLRSGDMAVEAASLGLAGSGGTVRAEGTLSGSVTRPLVTATLSGERVRVRDFTLGDLSVSASLDGAGTIFMNRFSLSNSGSRVDLSGSICLFREGLKGMNPDPSISLEIKQFSLNPGDFDGRLGGTVTLAGSLSGSVKDPRGSLTLSGSDLDLRFQKFRSLACPVSFRERKAWFDPLILTVYPGETIRCSGWIGTDRTCRFSLASDPISFSSIRALDTSGGLRGMISLDLKGSGPLDNPVISGSVAATRLGHGETDYGDMLIGVGLRDRRVSIKGRLNFDLEASYHLKNKNFTVAALFDKTDLAPYLAAAGRKNLGGTVSGTVRAAGNTASPERSDLAVSLSRFELESSGERLVSSRRFEALAAKGAFTIPGIDLSLFDTGWITVKGKGNLSGPLAVTCDARIPLAVANRFTDAVTNFTGTLTVKGGVTGTAAHPHLSADAGLDSIGFFIPAINNDVSGLTGRISLTPERVTIHDIQGSMDAGRFRIGGSMAMDGLKASDIRVNAEARNIPIEIPDTMRMTFDANARVTGGSAGTLIRGDVTVKDGTYYQDIVLRPLQELGAVPGKKAGGADDAARRGFLGSTAIDIAVRTGRPFIVDNNIAGLKVTSDLKIGGTLRKPVLSGSARVEDGVVHYLGRDFAITKGKIDFINPYRIEPLISVRGNARIQKWLVSIAVSGTPSSLRFDLSSSPVLDANNILSLVMLGKTTGGAMTYTTEDLLGQLIAFNYGGRIKKSTGIDIIEVKAPDPRSGRGQSVTIGKYLDRRFSVYYSVGKENGAIRTSSAAKYRLSDSILLDLKYDSKGEVGIDMQYTKEFR